jgi:hypothetical protein
MQAAGTELALEAARGGLGCSTQLGLLRMFGENELLLVLDFYVLNLPSSKI